MPLPPAPRRQPSAVERRPTPVFASRHSLSALPVDSESLDDASLLRHSAPTLARANSQPLSTKHAPESILMSTNVRIQGVEAREGHCVYALEVDTGYGTHTVHKRFSEIRDFRTELLAAVNDKKHCTRGPCSLLAQLTQIKFPRRRLRLPRYKKRGPSLDVARQRLSLLEHFLQAMLRVYRMTTRRQMRVCTTSKCVMLDTIKRFLHVCEPECVELDANPVKPERDSTPAPPPIPVAPTPLPRSFPDLAFTTLHGDKPAPLCSIDEHHEHPEHPEHATA